MSFSPVACLLKNVIVKHPNIPVQELLSWWFICMNHQEGGGDFIQSGVQMIGWRPLNPFWDYFVARKHIFVRSYFQENIPFMGPFWKINTHYETIGVMYIFCAKIKHILSGNTIG